MDLTKPIARPPRLRQAPLIEDDDDLFALHDHTCADCGTSFQTSKRTSRRCALCASLRSGPVGAATVQCPGCGVEHQIAILAPHKLCPTCASDLDRAAARLRAAHDAAQDAYEAATTRLDADLAHADEADQRRYQAAIEARATGMWRDALRPPSFFATQWQAAITRGDGLSPLLAARVAYDAAGEAWEASQRAVEEVERAMETQTKRETCYQLTEGQATYGLVVRNGVIVECAPYGRQRWMGKTEQALVAAGAKALL